MTARGLSRPQRRTGDGPDGHREGPRILDQAAALKFTGGVSFYFYSEALLDKRNVMFAREARSRRMKPYLHTNGDALRNNSTLLAAVREAYDYIVIGLYDYETDAELEAATGIWRRHLVHPDLRFSTISNGPPKSTRTMATPRALVPTSKRFNVPDFKYDAAPCPADPPHRSLRRTDVQVGDGVVCRRRPTMTIPMTRESPADARNHNCLCLRVRGLDALIKFSGFVPTRAAQRSGDSSLTTSRCCGMA